MIQSSLKTAPVHSPFFKVAYDKAFLTDVTVVLVSLGLTDTFDTVEVLGFKECLWTACSHIWDFRTCIDYFPK